MVGRETRGENHVVNVVEKEVARDRWHVARGVG